VQGVLGIGFNAVPDTPLPGKKTVVAGHERKAKRHRDGADESTLFSDEQRVPVEVIHVPNPDTELLKPDQYEVIGEKVTHRLARRAGSWNTPGLHLHFPAQAYPALKQHQTQTC